MPGGGGGLFLRPLPISWLQTVRFYPTNLPGCSYVPLLLMFLVAFMMMRLTFLLGCKVLWSRDRYLMRG